MGRDLWETYPVARATFQEADDVLGFPLSRLCFEGPEEELRQTVNAQPALLATSIACLRAAQEAGEGLAPGVAFVAGHSLGEYTALVAAGALSFPQALRLVRERGRLMQEAGQRVPSGMAALLGLEDCFLSEICQECGVEIANINCPGQVVISGPQEGLARAVELAKSKGARQVLPLNVSGAFHSAVMRPAQEGLIRFLETTSFQDASIPVVSNVTAEAVTSAAVLRDLLARQLCHPVRWQPSVEWMVGQGTTTFVEFGPGRVLSGLIKRTCRQAQVFNVGDLASLERFCRGEYGP
jgi:[acyl-carrier-protein] S-malonyltransferase